MAFLAMRLKNGEHILIERNPILCCCGRLRQSTAAALVGASQTSWVDFKGSCGTCQREEERTERHAMMFARDPLTDGICSAELSHCIQCVWPNTLFQRDMEAGPQVRRPGHTPRVRVLTFQITGDEEHYMVDEVEPDGSLFKTEYTAKFDGKAYPNKNLVTGEITYISLKKVDDHTELLESRSKPGGPVTMKYRRVCRVMARPSRHPSSAPTAPSIPSAYSKKR